MKGKKKALRRDFAMEIRKTLNRFLSIFLISALGAAFFAGIRATPGDMKLSADTFYDETNLMDLRVVGTLGVTQADAAAVKELDAVADAAPMYQADVLYVEENSELILRMLSVSDRMNGYHVTEGRLPEKENECLADPVFLSASGKKVGDTVTVSADSGESVTEILATDTYTIVGSGTSSMYMAFDRGTGSVGSGKVSAYLAVPEESFRLEAYTDLYITVAGAKELNSYSEEYKILIEEAAAQVGALEEERCLTRYDEVLAEPEKELADAKRELAEQEADANRELADAAAKIEDARQELADGRAEYEDGKRRLSDAKKEIADSEKELADAKRQIDAGDAELADGRSLLNEGWRQLSEEEGKLKAAAEEYEAGLAEYEKNRKEFDEAPAGLDAKEQEVLSGLAQAKAQISEGEKMLADWKAQLKQNEAVLDREEKKLTQAREEYADGVKRLAEAKETVAENEAKLLEAEADLADGEKELADAERDYNEAKKEAEEKIADAKRELAEAEEELGKITLPEWYLFDRDDISGVYDFGQDSDRIAAIGEVFPIMFFLVAALVSLTTMARMVDEERVQIGTLKALGYSRRDIAKKYILYGFFASLGGSIFGVLVGEWLFPFVIAATYAGMVYTGLPHIYMPINLYYAVLATVITTACTVAVTYYACIHELKAQPAALMRPAPPKSGRRVFLERIPFLWKHFNFTWKSTVRNLLRYKKRFFMTVFGIGGCMALLLVGFGIKDSIGVMAKLQYSELWYQDAVITLNTGADESDRNGLFDDLSADSRIAGMLKTRFQTEDMEFEGRKQSVTNVIVEDAGNLDDFFCFRDLDTGERYSLTDDEIIITQKLSGLLNAKAGDTVTLKNGKGTGVPVTVAAVTEHYIQHFSFMTRALYERLYGEEPEYNQCLLVLADGGRADSSLAKDILSHDDAALSVSFTDSLQESIDNMLKGLNIVVYVLIAAAGMLAFVVLYNLNNININERKRELATLRVLGFFNQETAVYVYRENAVLTVIGTLFGIGLGVVLHRFVMETVEVNLVMFGREIFPASFLYSALFTFGFSAFICLVMYKKIKKINMVESLKSVE